MPKTAAVAQSFLGAIGASDLDAIAPLSPQDLKDRSARLAGIWGDLEDELYRMRRFQEETAIRQCVTAEDIAFVRGTLNGFEVVRQRFANLVQRHRGAKLEANSEANP